jgi:two-component system, chemotaxis family, sensor kinase CheA
MTNDPYRYFRVEARELLEGLTQGALDLEKGTGDKSAVASLLRLAHTLKGASRVVKQPEIADLAHAMEGILSPYREGERTVPRESATDLLRLADAIAGRVAVLDAPREPGTAPSARPAAEELLETVRVEVEEVEELLSGLAEAGVEITALDSQAEVVKRVKRLAGALLEQLPQQAEPDGFGRGRVRPMAEQLVGLLEHAERNLTSGLARAKRELAQTHETAQRLRLLPAAAIFPSLARAARDAASTLGKQVELVSAGGEIRLEANVLVVLRDALLHVIRNALAHGIETAEARRAAGKPAVGRVSLTVERRGNHVVLLCRDDGCGIDLAAVRQAAVKSGVVSATAAESLGREETIQLLLRGGLSTTGTVTGISGRGIGLDVVREAAARLKGEVSIETSAGAGTGVEIRVPVSLLSIPALLVDAAGTPVLIPLDSVRRVMTIAATDIARSGTAESILFEGQAIPFARLGQLLRRETIPARRELWPVVAIASGTSVTALSVDRLAEMLLRPLPEQAAAAPEIGGACLDADGNPRLVLDPAGLMAALQNLPSQSPVTAPRKRPTVLVIDDSLTTRMLEKSILESAGFDVELATSGEEGMEKARARDYALFLVDIEMPGMDGFEFLSQTRHDPRLRETPAILVTSRNSSEDRSRGQQLGASDFIVKSEFDQGYLLRVIRQLVGSS